MKLKGMLAVHGVRDFNVSNTKRAKALLRYILSRSGEGTATATGSLMGDALLIVDAYHNVTLAEAYTFRCQRLLTSPDGVLVGEVVDLLRSLDHADYLVVGQEVVLWLQDKLNEVIRDLPLRLQFINCACLRSVAICTTRGAFLSNLAIHTPTCPFPLPRPPSSIPTGPA